MLAGLCDKVSHAENFADHDLNAAHARPAAPATKSSLDAPGIPAPENPAKADPVGTSPGFNFGRGAKGPDPAFSSKDRNNWPNVWPVFSPGGMGGILGSMVDTRVPSVKVKKSSLSSPKKSSMLDIDEPPAPPYPAFWR